MQIIISNYSTFSTLAHTPAGTESKYALTLFSDKKGDLQHERVFSNVHNAAYMKIHNEKLYVLSESIQKEDTITVYDITDSTVEPIFLQAIGSNGFSACYIHIVQNRLFIVNYWNSVLSSYEINSDGTLTFKNCTAGNGIKLTRAMHLKDRHSESHFHSVESYSLDRQRLYVPDLGDDVIHTFTYDGSGKLNGKCDYKVDTSDRVHGPRYIVFNEVHKCAYVVNEISNSVSVLDIEKCTGALTCRAIVEALDVGDNKSTCGGILIHPSHKFVLVSNRGNDSISTFKTDEHGNLSRISITPVMGRTPRHFQFDKSGKLLLTANQDSDNVSVFEFNANNGHMTFVKHLGVPSPNFIVFV